MNYLPLLYTGMIALPAYSSVTGEHQKPNIILIFADDMGYGDAGCYGGTNLVPTPNVDRLARDGVRFTDGYVTAPVCGPSRYGLLTGAYQQRFGIQWNPDCYAKLPGREETPEKNRIPSTQKTMDQALQKAGYITGIIGKWNLPNYPRTTFDETMSVMHFGGDYWPDVTGHYAGVDDSVARGGQKDIYWGPVHEGDEYLTDRLGRQAVEFINRHAEKPFFLYLAFNAPHSPMQAKKSHAEAVAHLKTEVLRYYGAMLLSLDENVGKVLKALDDKGLSGNTLVVFSSDNGPTFAYNVDWPREWPKELIGSAGPLNGYKGQFLEGGIRIPYIMRWPDRLQGGQVFKKPVSTLDLYPTFCAAANADTPVGTIIDGVDLIPFLTGKKKDDPHKDLFWYSSTRGAVRSGKWKLLAEGDRQMLFDLETDLGETTDLSGKYPDIKLKLAEEYSRFCAQMPPNLNPN